VRRLTLELKRGVPGHPALDVGPGPCHDRPLRVDGEREVFRHNHAGRASKRLSAAGRTLELDRLAVVADPGFIDSYPSLAVGLIAAAGRPQATGLSLAAGRRPAAGAPRRRPGFAARPARGAPPTGRQHHENHRQAQRSEDDVSKSLAREQSNHSSGADEPLRVLSPTAILDPKSFAKP